MFFNCHINRKLLLMKISFFLFDSGTAPINPFLPTIARQKGIPLIVIGVIFTCMPILNIITRPISGFITDRWHCRKQVFLGASVVNAFVTLLILFTPDFHDVEYVEETDVFWHWKFWVFFGTIFVRNILWMAGDVLQDTICLDILGDDKIGYGKQRVWGAIGWGLTTLMVGASVDWYSEGSKEKNYLPAYLIAMTFMLLHFVVASRLSSHQSEASKSMTKEVINIISDVKVSTYLIWAMFGGIFTSYIWFYLFIYIEDLANIYHRERLPYIDTIQGFSITVQCCISEIPIYMMSELILKRIGHMAAFSISFMMFGIRFFLYSIITDPLWVLPVELLNGVTFTLTFVAGISYAAEVAPIGSEGTLQGLFGMAFHGLGFSTGSFMAGYTFDQVGSSASFRLLSYVAFSAFIIQSSVNKLIQIKKPKEIVNKPKEPVTDSCDPIPEQHII